MSTVAALDLEMVQLDVKTLFLYGDLEKEIYLEQPEGFVVSGHETEEFKQSDADPCLFIRKRENETTKTRLALLNIVQPNQKLQILQDPNKNGI
ncbi:hypothetical protein DAPPUDRAFT_244213 [Daphnia pulex]|uniref:Reverse transcriptase Ty1/copia-type domain-containing protein n=1 Tax=Daphnia pulex TaxID=6669 RepID=E9GKG1_DAPPU|nr:hypothetical protein DAPPUDRAFT_244213 [Daphnia pulex]|eukprot:EFX79987.1 hypothetical protein DAPPUDRAFT_244213 [Daphnia pulex]